MPQAPTTATNTGNTPPVYIPTTTQGSESSKPADFLEKKQEGIASDIQFLQTRIASAKHEFSRALRPYKESGETGQKSKDDLLSFKAARENASNSFFAIMRPKLKKANAMKYAGTDRLLLDRDLLTLKKALGSKIPFDKSDDWHSPFLIQEFQRNTINPLQQSVFHNSGSSSGSLMC
ncbi:hypothetical protein ACROYT_G013832 [Oculina patagonica]